MVALYTLVHLVNFPCTVSIIPLYNDEIYPSEVMCPCTCVNYISNGLVEKMVDELRLIFFFSNIIIGKVSKFLCGS